MNNKNNNNIRVFTELEVSKECSYISISSKDRFNRVVGSKGPKQAFFGCRSPSPVLKSSRILRRINNNNTSPIDNRKIDLIDKMTTTDGNQEAMASLPTTLVQENNNGSTLSTTAEDDDDVTIRTSNSNPTKQG
jgi:hypothetical protein